MLDLFNKILDDLFSCNRKNNLNNIKKINEEIVKSRMRISNAQKLMLDGDLSIEEYKEIRINYQNTIDDLTVQLSNFNNVEDDYKEQLKFGISLISDIDKYYDQSDLEIKQLIIGSIFPGKLIYDENKFRTKRLNEFIELICLNNNWLEIKKEVLKRKKSFQHHQVIPLETEPYL